MYMKLFERNWLGNNSWDDFEMKYLFVDIWGNNLIFVNLGDFCFVLNYGFFWLGMNFWVRGMDIKLRGEVGGLFVCSK